MNTSNIHCTSYVNHPYTQVRDTLLANPHYVFRHATAAAAIGDAALHISLGLFDIGTDVAIEVAGVEYDRGFQPPATVLKLVWSAVKHRDSFPTMNATLTMYSLSPTETELVIDGKCRRPKGSLGTVIYAAIGHRVVQASVERFTQAVAGWLREELLLPIAPLSLDHHRVAAIPTDTEC